MLQALLSPGFLGGLEEELHRSPFHGAKPPAVQQMDDDRNGDRKEAPEHCLLDEGHLVSGELVAGLPHPGAAERIMRHS